MFGAAAATCSPAVIETLGDVGMDFVWVDLEHGGPSPNDTEALEGLARAAAVADTELLVRLPSPDPHVIRKVLDTGVRTILISRVDTASEARRAVDAARFVHEGEPGQRGIGVGRASGWGARLDGDFVAAEDESVLVGAMIETRSAVENASEILSVPGLGFVFLGPADLSVSLGRPMETAAEEVRDAIERVERAAEGSPVALGGIRNDPADVEAAIDDGYRILRVGGDVGAIRATLSARLAAIEDQR